MERKTAKSKYATYKSNNVRWKNKCLKIFRHIKSHMNDVVFANDGKDVYRFQLIYGELKKSIVK
jgi:hypothetical protein